MSPFVQLMSFNVEMDNVSPKLFSVMNRLTVRMDQMRMPVVLTRIPTVLLTATQVCVNCPTVSALPTEQEFPEKLIQTKYLK